MSKRSLTTKPSASPCGMASASSFTAAIPEDNTPLSQGLAEPPSSSLPSSSSTLPASTPTESKAISLAKTKQVALQIHLTHRFHHTESDSPCPASPPYKTLLSEPNPNPTPALTTPKEHVSSHSITFPSTSRKRGGEEFGIEEKPAAKRRDAKQHGQTPAPRTQRAKYDHWSPSSSRASSPVRPVIIPAEKWYAHRKSSLSLKEMDTRRKLEVSASERPAGKRQEKAEEKAYNSWRVKVVEKAGEEDKRECYNCGKKGDWFMDCLSGCGKCNGDGHRTIDCGVVKVNIGLRGAE